MKRPPDERDMEQAVRSWMRDDDEHAADRNRQVGRIMGRVDETRQRRGAWRFLPFGRRPKRIDEHDDELFAAGRDGLVGARRSIVPSLAVVVAALALILTSYAFFVARPTPEPVLPAAEASPSPEPSTTPEEDAELFARMRGLWSGRRTSLDDVLAVYSEDAVHTALWHDKVEYFEGHSQILDRIQGSETVNPGGWSRLPDADTGEHRYLSATQRYGGVACVVWVEDARITRHDCILPYPSRISWLPSWELAAAETLEVRDSIWPEFTAGWEAADQEMIGRVVAPDVVHRVALDNHAYTHKGLDAYIDVMGDGVAVLAPPLALPAPQGEARWSDFNDVGPGTLCTFWAREARIIRHDCIVPGSASIAASLVTPEPRGT